MNEARAESQARMGYACKKEEGNANRRRSKRRAELGRAIPSEEEEGKANDNNIKYLIHKRSNISL